MIFLRLPLSGGSIWIMVSIRPGRRKAPSIIFIRFVAPSQNTVPSTVSGRSKKRKNMFIRSVRTLGFLVDSIPVSSVQTVEAVIKPPQGAISGDYSVTLSAQSENTSNTLELRVTVFRPNIWGWVSLFLGLLVIGGLLWVYPRFGRR